MNGAVLSWLMMQLMAFSCLINIVLSVSWAPGGPPEHGEGPRLPPGGPGAPGVPRPPCNEGRDGGTDLHTLTPNASVYYF